jgi:hypothetical protein
LALEEKMFYIFIMVTKASLYTTFQVVLHHDVFCSNNTSTKIPCNFFFLIFTGGNGSPPEYISFKVAYEAFQPLQDRVQVNRSFTGDTREEKEKRKRTHPTTHRSKKDKEVTLRKPRRQLTDEKTHRGTSIAITRKSQRHGSRRDITA